MSECTECGCDMGRHYDPPIMCAGCEVAHRYEAKLAPLQFLQQAARERGLLLLLAYQPTHGWTITLGPFGSTAAELDDAAARVLAQVEAVP